MRRTRHIWAMAACTVAGVVVFPLAAAWACTSLATLSVNPSQGASGQQVSAVGNGFGRISNGHGPVEIRWNSSGGPLLATVAPSATGTINFSFIAPAGEPGYYTVIASQKHATTGATTGGTPARATFALNSPPAQAISGAGGATTVDQQAAIEAPSSVAFAAPQPVFEEAQQPAAVAAPAPAAQQPVVAAAPATPAVAAPAPAARPVVVAPAQPLAPIAPSDARSRDVLAPGGADSFLGGPGLTLVLIGALALAGAAVAAAVAPRFAVRRTKR